MSKSIIYVGNASPQETSVAGTTVQFTNVVRRYGCNCKASGGNIVLLKFRFVNRFVTEISDFTI